METLPFNDQKFLETLIEKMEKNDNHLTGCPLYVIYEQVEVSVGSGGDWEFKVWVDEDYQVKEKMFVDKWDDASAAEYDAKYPDHTYGKRVSKPNLTYGFFLTEEEAQKFIKQFDYRFTSPMIFTHSANGSPELKRVLQILFRLCGKKIPSKYL